MDATANEHEQAETLPDRSVLKSSNAEPMRYGHKYSWVVSLVNFGTSWAAPVDIEKVDTEATDTNVVGVTKAYTTRVGGGPLPTEILDTKSAVYEQFGEVAATTGRIRRVG